MKIINDLIKADKIGGTFLRSGIEAIMDASTNPTNTYYWDDSNQPREGVRLELPEGYIINKVVLYACDSYPLYKVNFELDGKVIYSQSSVSLSNPMIFEGSVSGKILDLVRYTVRDSTINKIIVYGYPLRKCVIRENSLYYSIDKKYYDINLGTYTPIQKDPSEDLRTFIENNGFEFTDLTNQISIDNTLFYPLEKFDNYKIIFLDKVIKLNIASTKSNQELIVSKQNLSTYYSAFIHKFIPTVQKAGTGELYTVVSNDGGISWKSWDKPNLSWITLPISAPLKDYCTLNEEELVQWNSFSDVVKSEGMTIADIQKADFNLLRSDNKDTFRFAYVLSTPKDTDAITLKELKYLINKTNNYVQITGGVDASIKLYSMGCEITALKTNLDNVKVNILL